MLDDQVVADALSRALGQDMPDAILVGINCTLDGAAASDFHGLDLAIQRIQSRRPIILTSFYERAWFNLNRKFHFLMGHLNCGFVRLPAGLDEIRDKYETVKYQLNPDSDDEHEYREDELCLSLLDLRDQESEKRVLIHDLTHARAMGQMAEWLERAKLAGYCGSQEEIVAAVEAQKLPNYSPFASRFFRGTFVDLEGTLIKNGELDQEVMKLVRHSPGHTTLWTGGELDHWAKVCREHRLPWKVMSKWLFRGVTVEYAFDDQAREELGSVYGFDVQRFRRV